MRLAGRDDPHPGRHRVAEGVALGHQGAGDRPRGHRRAGQDLLGCSEARAAVVGDVHPDLARPVEVVVHEDDLGLVGRRGRRQDRGGDPVAIDAERRAAGAALRDCPRAVRPGRALVHRLPHVGLERRSPLTAGQVAEVDGIRLVGREAVVAAAWVGRCDLSPVRPLATGGVGDGAAAGRGVVELPQLVGGDRRLAAVGADIGQGVARRTRRQASTQGGEKGNRSRHGQYDCAPTPHYAPL